MRFNIIQKYSFIGNFCKNLIYIIPYLTVCIQRKIFKFFVPGNFNIIFQRRAQDFEQVWRRARSARKIFWRHTYFSWRHTYFSDQVWRQEKQVWRYEKISNQLANKGILVTQMHCTLKKSISERGTQVGALVIGNLGNYKQRFQNKCIVHYKRKHLNVEHAIFLASLLPN